MRRSKRGMPTLAYSNVRFCSAAQEEGDSERRQLDAARQYAEEKGFLGRESRRRSRTVRLLWRKPVRRCARGICPAVQTGEIPPSSALRIENPNRLSRQRFAQARTPRSTSPCWRRTSNSHFVSRAACCGLITPFVDLLQVGVKIDRATSKKRSEMGVARGRSGAKEASLRTRNCHHGSHACRATRAKKAVRPIKVDEQKRRKRCSSFSAWLPAAWAKG